LVLAAIGVVAFAEASAANFALTKLGPRREVSTARAFYLTFERFSALDFSVQPMLADVIQHPLRQPRRAVFACFQCSTNLRRTHWNLHLCEHMHACTLRCTQLHCIQLRDCELRTCNHDPVRRSQQTPRIAPALQLEKRIDANHDKDVITGLSIV